MEYRIITHNIILMSLVWAFGFVCNSDSNSRFRERKFVKHTAYMFGLKMAFAQKRRARCCRGTFCDKNIDISGIFHSNLRKNMKTFSTTTLCNQKKKQTTKCRRQKPERLATLRTGISIYRAADGQRRGHHCASLYLWKAKTGLRQRIRLRRNCVRI